MIVKGHEPSYRYLIDQALERRLLPNHFMYPEVQQRLQWRHAGYRGEQAIDYYLRRFDQTNLFVFFNIRLFNGSDFFEIDTLLLTTKFILIIEIKNFSGILHFDPVSQQLRREYDEKSELYPNPILQVEAQKEQLHNWLKRPVGFSDLPIHAIVAIANEKTIINVTDPEHRKDIFGKVMHFPRIKTYYDHLSVLNATNQINQVKLMQLKNKILQADTPYQAKLESLYPIKKSAIRKGVHCPKCQVLSMTRVYAKWHCSTCGAISKDAHTAAIDDYLLLIEQKITRQACRDFLQIRSVDVAQRLLLKQGLRHVIKGKYSHFEKANHT